MRLLLVFIGLIITTSQAFAEGGGALSFAPPPGDVSIQFLANIFGVVDGVLHGTGSQIVGQMFGVFNAAVLSVGGVIILYTMTVSTMNTAQEGEVLGRKWSSIWVPVRSTVGIGLLLPKASGYCLMQIFVMWVVVQGVGAADKVWGAALDYLGRGGVIVQQNTDVANLKAQGADGSKIIDAASGILIGQVCMQALESSLVKIRAEAKGNTNSGTCYNTDFMDGYDKDGSIGIAKAWQTFCDTPVPNFINSVDIASQTLNGNTYSASFPQFTDDFYKQFNGVCGTLTWNKVTIPGGADSFESRSNRGVIESTRSIAVQQMYQALSPVAVAMVNNDTDFLDADEAEDVNPHEPFIQLFGHLMKEDGAPCQNLGADCFWGTGEPGEAPLFTGTEILNAVAAYNGLMMPTINLINTLNNGGGKGFSDLTDFKTKAKEEGWMLAGSYFFDLAAVNQNSASGDYEERTNQTDVNSGLKFEFTSGDTTKIVQIETKGEGQSSKPAAPVDITKFTGGLMLPSGDSDASGARPCNGKLSCQIFSWGQKEEEDSVVSHYRNYWKVLFEGHSNNHTSVFSYLDGANKVSTPDQKKNVRTEFKLKFNFSPSSQMKQLPRASFSGGTFGIPGRVASYIYNDMIRYIFNMMLTLLMELINRTLTLIIVPIVLLLSITFSTAVANIQDPNVNPIVALANMGTTYINGVGELFSATAVVLGAAGGVPMVGQGIAAMGMLVVPWLMAFMGVMLTVGMMTAYYVPFLPYMIFTFAALGWMIGVIEAMVAAPIVALGIIHPEGHEAFGKADQAMMLMFNVFLRPAMMIMGFIFAISLSYVGIWMMNLGFSHTMEKMLSLENNPASRSLGTSNAARAGVRGDGFTGTRINGGDGFGTGSGGVAGGAAGVVDGATEAVGRYQSTIIGGQATAAGAAGNWAAERAGRTNDTYNQWAGIYAYFFLIMLYTSMYISIVQKSFELIHYLPDKILRWLSGGQQESLGSETAGMAKGIEQKMDQASSQVSAGMASSLKKGKQGGNKPAGTSTAKDPKKPSDDGKGGGSVGTGDSSKGGGGGNSPEDPGIGGS